MIQKYGKTKSVLGKAFMEGTSVADPTSYIKFLQSKKRIVICGKCGGNH